MEQQEKDQLVKNFVNEVVNANDDASSIPLTVGDELTFELKDGDVKKQPAQGAIREWTAVTSVEGKRLSLRQLIRRGNGLQLEGVKTIERATSFFNKATGAQYRIRITAVRQRESVDASGAHSIQNYLMFTEL